MNDHETETELDVIIRVLDRNGVSDTTNVGLQIRSALVDRKIHQLKRDAAGITEALRPAYDAREWKPIPGALYPSHPFNGMPGIIGGNCRTCGGPITEPWHGQPYVNIGQPCSGWVCDGHHDLCPDCDNSYRDHRESMKPY